MAQSSQRPCGKPGCVKLVRGKRFCAAHTRETRSGSYAQRAGVPRADWEAVRRSVLAANPFCAACLQRGEHTASCVVDHIRPHKGDLALFFDSANLQALCKRCHDRKTVNDDGGFGR